MIDLFEPGEIKRKAQSYEKITRAIMMASADPDEPWVETELITLRQFALDISIAEIAQVSFDPDDIETLSTVLANTKYKMQREFVSVTPDRITIGVNCDVIDDDITMNAMMMLCEIEDLTVSESYYFGSAIDTSVDNSNE